MRQRPGHDAGQQADRRCKNLFHGFLPRSALAFNQRRIFRSGDPDRGVTYFTLPEKNLSPVLVALR
jgi:hypothetical protein